MGIKQKKKPYIFLHKCVNKGEQNKTMEFSCFSWQWEGSQKHSKWPSDRPRPLPNYSIDLVIYVCMYICKCLHATIKPSRLVSMFSCNTSENVGLNGSVRDWERLGSSRLCSWRGLWKFNYFKL